MGAPATATTAAARGAGRPAGDDVRGQSRRRDEVEILVFEKWPNIAVVSVVVDAHPDDDDDERRSLFTPKAAEQRREEARSRSSRGLS